MKMNLKICDNFEYLKLIQKCYLVYDLPLNEVIFFYCQDNDYINQLTLGI